MPDVPIYRVGPQIGAPLCVPDVLNNREGPQAREPSKCLDRRSYGERLAKEAFWLSAIRGSEKDSDRAITPGVEAVCVPAHFASPGPHRKKERNQRWNKQVERYSMFLGMKNQYCENDYTTKCNLQIQCDPYQITNGIFTKLEQNVLQFVWKHKRSWIAKAILRKTNGAEGNQPSWLQDILHSCSNQNTMVLAQKQKHRPIEEDIKPMHLKAPYLWRREQK